VKENELVKKLQAIAELKFIPIGSNGRDTQIESAPVIQRLLPCPVVCDPCGRVLPRPPVRVYNYRQDRRVTRCQTCRCVQHEAGAPFVPGQIRGPRK